MKFYKTSKILKKLFPNVIWKSKNNDVLLTIDDSPTPKGTEKVLKTLQSKNIKALFFVMGIQAEKHKEIVKMINSAGHMIGNHSYNHKSLLFESSSIIADEINANSNLIVEIIEQKPLYFRPPFGRYNFFNNRLLEKLNYKCVMWDVFPYDYKNNLNIIKLGVKKISAGSIVVMHDNFKTENNIEENFKILFDEVEKKGLKFGDPDKCLN